MKTAIIIHGILSAEELFIPQEIPLTEKHWLPWLAREIRSLGIETTIPEMPNLFSPTYEDWKKVFEQFPVDEETILVGHSCGGGFLVRWLSETNVKVGKVFLVAPWIDTEKELTTGFFDFTIDENLVGKTSGVHLLYSTDDDAEILASVTVLREKIHNMTVQEFTDRGHFTREEGYTMNGTLPEVLAEIVG